MGHHSCCNQQKVKRGLWSPEEDEKLVRYITTHGYGCWSEVPEKAGLQRCGKSCRLRWINYLRPDLKRGNFTEEEDELIIKLHEFLGNKWSLIAGRLPGRTDNEIKNYWNTHVKRKLLARGVDPHTHRPLNAASAALQGMDTPSSPATASQSSEVDDGVTLLPPPAGHLGGMIDLNLSISPPCQPSSPPPMREAEARIVGDGAFRTGYASEREEGICLCLNRLGLQGGVGCSCGGASPSPSLSSQVFNFRFVDASLQRS